MELLEHFVSGGDWLDENGEFIRNRIGQKDKVTIGKGKILGKCTIATEDSEHRPIRAMTPEAGTAEVAFSAGSIDLAADSLTRYRASRIDQFADKFMAGNAMIIHITTNQLEV